MSGEVDPQDPALAHLCCALGQGLLDGRVGLVLSQHHPGRWHAPGVDQPVPKELSVLARVGDVWEGAVVLIADDHCKISGGAHACVEGGIESGYVGVG